ncbi:hypothetical protein [Thomasclavelia spiroformis]|nr:hypothetical protein [Thomasclavelia spiroformis]MBS6114737.1 hypothetical protein [Thomasclavelia spiroformis]
MDKAWKYKIESAKTPVILTFLISSLFCLLTGCTKQTTKQSYLQEFLLH